MSLGSRLGGLGLGLGWLVGAAILALGAAGIVAGADHPPGGDARPELTWAADRAIAPGLADAVGDLTRVSRDVDGLGALGREALAALTRRDLSALSAAIEDGTTVSDTIDSETEALRTRLEQLPGGGGDARTVLGAATLARYDGVVAALSTTGDLSSDWGTFARGGVAAMELTTLLGQHDQEAGDAARLGSKGDYAGALAGLGTAEATLGQVRQRRDAIANTSDVTTLGQWIDRNAAMDDALKALYTALKKSRGQATPDVVKALDAVKQARANLPPDTRALVVIMSDFARGGLNQAVISIEDARGQLAAAIDALGSAAVPSGSPAPTGSPSPSAAASATAP